MASKSTPSVFRIIQVDYGATLGFAAVIASIFVFIIALYTVRDNLIYFFKDANYLLVFPVLMFIGLMVVYWRVKNIRSVFNNGIEVPGVINQVMATNKRYVNNVGCTYTFDNRMHSSVYTITKSKHTRFLELGKDVTMVVDPDNPERALIKEVYV